MNLGLTRNTWLIIISQFLIGVTFGLWFYILPVHLRTLGASPSQVGFTLSAMGFSTLIMVLPIGYLADRYDLRKLMIIMKSFPIIPLMLLATTRQWQFVMLLIFVIFIEGSVVTVFNSFLTRVVEPEDLQRSFSMVTSGYLIGEVVFRSVGAWIAECAGMELVFYLSAVVSILSLVPIFFIQLEGVEAEPFEINYLPLLRSKVFIHVSLYIFTVLLLMEVAVALVPNYLSEVVGLELPSLGWMGSLTALGGALLCIYYGRMKTRWGLISAQVSMILSLVLLLFIPLGPYLLTSVFLMGSRYGSFPLVDALMGSIVHPQLSGLAFAFVGVVFGLSQLLGPVISGVLYELSPPAPMITASFGLAVLTIVTITSPRFRIWKGVGHHDMGR